MFEITSPATFVSNPPAARFFKGLEQHHTGYQQSYPQKFWIYQKPPMNQALATDTTQATQY
ncbi:MAG: hypothetical protein ACK543_11595 [Acidovorax sp.]